MSDVVIPVHAEHRYDVVIGRGLLAHLPAMVSGSQRVAVIHPGSLVTSAEAIRDDLQDAGVEVTLVEVPDAEDAKTAEVAAFCWSVLGSAGFTRSDTVVGLGGGATTDLAGFVAATWLRGIRVVQIPTTLLAMVDAAVGGKTGINTAAGKNLVGSFWSPGGVLCDINALDTLPRNDLLAGMAEVVKIGFVRDTSILDDVERDPFGSTDAGGDLLPDLIRRAVQVKADVVGLDFRETSATAGDGSLGREVLNYGHTFGHAVERRERYRWRHGAAVSVGHDVRRGAGRPRRPARRVRRGPPSRRPHGARPPDHLRARALGRAARGDVAGQEGAGLTAALRRPERDRPAGDLGGTGPGAAGRRVRIDQRRTRVESASCRTSTC